MRRHTDGWLRRVINKTPNYVFFLLSGIVAFIVLKGIWYLARYTWT